MSEARRPLTVSIVSYRNGDAIIALLEALRPQLGDQDRVVVVDNASGDGTAELIEHEAGWVTLIRSEANLGFAAGANLAAGEAPAGLLVFLNPDVVPEPGAIDALRSAAGRWDICQGLVTEADGETINTAGGELHFTGIAWAGGHGAPRASAGPEREVDFASGACLAIGRELWDQLGGFDEALFMYCEDVELSLRARLLGARVGVVPEAAFRHEYEFDKGPAKWELLERNRWLTVLRTYPVGLLAAVLPLLLAIEPVLMVVAARGGWLGPKLRAQGGVLASLPRTLRERRDIQRARGDGATKAIVERMRPELDSPFLGSIGRSRLVAVALGAYWRAARALAVVFSRR